HLVHLRLASAFPDPPASQAVPPGNRGERKKLTRVLAATMNRPLKTGSQRQAHLRPRPHQVTTTSRAAPAAIFTPVRRRAQRYRGLTSLLGTSQTGWRLVGITGGDAPGVESVAPLPGHAAHGFVSHDHTIPAALSLLNGRAWDLGRQEPQEPSYRSHSRSGQGARR